MFEEVIEEDEEFAHDGGEGEFGRFVGGAQVEVESAQDVVGAGGAQSGHVEGVAQPEAAAGDVALIAQVAAIVIKGSDAEECRGLRARERAELRAEGQAGRGGEEANSWDLGETSGLGGESCFEGEGFGHGGLELLDLATEQGEARLGQRPRQLGGLRGELEQEAAALEDGLLAGDHEFLQEKLGRGGRPVGERFDQGTEIQQGLRIDGVGFGLAAEALGKVAHLAWIGDGDQDPRGVCGADQGPMARACGLTNQMSADREFGQEAPVARRVVGQRTEEEKAFENESLFGEIDTEISGRRRRGWSRLRGLRGHGEMNLN